VVVAIKGKPIRYSLALLALLLLAYAVVLVRTAWMCDDAFITLRTVDNFVQGYGLVWNVGERVQVYTHPL
jgi:arabinofuranosyltransferase